MGDESASPERSRSAGVSTTVGPFVALLALTIAMTGIVLAVVHHSPAGGRALGATTGPYGAPTPTVEVELSEFHVTVSQFASVRSGNVIFVVKNAGSIDHEMIVLRTDRPFDKLPIRDGGDPPAPVKARADKVDEAANVGETGDPNLKPGGTRTFTIKKMPAGTYALVCNLAAHYGLGMRATFTVY